MKILSIVIPVYNEEKTIKQILERVEGVRLENFTKEIIIIDDGSTDQTRGILKNLENKYKILYQEKNLGEGTTVRRGFKESTGDFIIIQDADLEYNPEDYKKFLDPFINDNAQVVYGSRFSGGEKRRVLFFWHSLGNKFLTSFSNMLSNLTLTDMEVCYKAFSREALDIILPELTANNFGIEPELTALAAKHHLRIYETSITYHGRTYAEGKKINWKDGLAAIWYIIKYNIIRK